MKKNVLKNQKGFTLIEIIAVLVILGILAAVAIPRYFDLMEESRNNAAQSAIAEVQARASSTYASGLLSTGAANCTVVYNGVNSNISTLGDFTASVTSGCPSRITISVSAVKGKTLNTSQTGTWTYPVQ